MSKRPIAPAAVAVSCCSCKQTLVAEIQLKLQANHGVLDAENAIIMESLGVGDTKDIIDMFFNLLIETQDQQIAPPKPSPSRASVVIPCDETFKRIMSPCDPEFLFLFRDSFKGVPIPEFWQHFRGPLLVSPEGQFGCAMCKVEAVVSSNGTSLLCPKRSQFPDAKKAQEQGCFFILKVRVAEITADKQDDILAYNDSKSAKVVKKTSDIAKEILAAKRVKPDE
jgi:hypothetical protein